MNTSQLGNVGESRIVYEFTKLGVQCFSPCGNGSLVDLVADFGGRLNKIQIKTVEKPNADGVMVWKVTHQDGFHGSRKVYSEDEIDYFAFYCLSNDTVCLVPFDKEFPSTTFSIRPDDYVGTRIKTMRFASDFSFEKIIQATLS